MSLIPMIASPLGFAPPIFAHPRLDTLQERARACGRLRAGVVYPCEQSALGAALEASEQGFIDPVLIGPSALIRRIAAELGKDRGGVRRPELWRIQLPPEQAPAASATWAALPAPAGVS